MYEFISQDELTKIQTQSDKDAVYCRICGKAIWYRNTKVHRCKNGELRYMGTTYKSTKMINGVRYSLTCCEKCMCDEYADFAERNIKRIFNTCNKYTSYGFEIPKDVINDVNSSKSITLEHCIRKYGQAEGEIKYAEYCGKQSYKNTFEGKRNKFGWDKETFDAFNKSRSVTLDNLIEKYGVEVGTEKYQAYIERQKITKSKEYVVETYGLEHWEKLCKSKGCALENYVRRFGDSVGLEEYKKALQNRIKYTSNMATSYFSDLISFGGDVFDGLVCYYGKDNEFGFYDGVSCKYYFIDFCIPSIKVAVEFNGNYFHANPKYYNSDYNEFWFTDKSANEIWAQDDVKHNAIRKLGYELFVVWEDDINDDSLKNKIIDFIKSKRNATRV